MVDNWRQPQSPPEQKANHFLPQTKNPPWTPREGSVVVVVVWITTPCCHVLSPGAQMSLA